jgi:uncharacterized protein (DUF1501 family)
VDPQRVQSISRRELLQRAGMGMGGLALSHLLNRDGFAAAPSHFQPRAKHVIYIHLVGGPSHLDLFDFKPELQKRNGEQCPDEMFKGKQLAFIRSHPKLLGPSKGANLQFKSCGESGIGMSNLLPNLQDVVDDMCFVRTVHTEQFNHAPAQMFMQTGFARFGRPSLGSWVNYGLGSENENLPGFVVMVTGQYPGAGNSIFGSGFLPSVYQGVEFRGSGDPVLFLSNPKGMDDGSRKRMVDRVNRLNQLQLKDVGDPEIATRISQYEMAYRMQSSVPELMDTKSESKAMHALYGSQPGKASFANNCLLARRLVERGVRFVQLFDQGWDHHGGVFKSLPGKCKQVDRPLAALIKDLKSRGLLDETLIVWGSEFGRTPMAQGSGRDHHAHAFTLWMAGGGVKGGTTYGETDELGYRPVENPVHVHDFNATIMHLLGMDHEQLTFRYQGRPFRLTDIAGQVVRDICV